MNTLKHTGKIAIATGHSRKETSWKNKEMMWHDFIQSISTTTRTRETYAQYSKMTRDERSEIKDVGGFVGGIVKSGRRKAGNVNTRSLITLDADFADAGFWGRVQMLFGNACAVYSTHSHHPEKQKLRMIVPMTRYVSPDEYEAISRFVAAGLGIDIFDDTTYQPERLMYWPSTAADGEFFFNLIDAPFLDPDAVLAKHPDWKDASTWPESSRAHQIRQRHAEKQGDPRTKPGAVGAFCRTYTVSQAIEMFLPNVYTKCDIPNRYTFAAGSASAGVIVYDSDLFAFSHHGTDPAGGILCNAYDLVRIHAFGIKDEDSKPETPVYKLPSYEAMNAWAITVDAVKIELANAKAAEAAAEFGNPLNLPLIQPGADAWKTKLVYNEKGGIIQSIHNALLVLRHDQYLHDLIGINEFNRSLCMKHTAPWREIKRPDLWTDADDANLRHFLEVAYQIKKKECIFDALQIISKENAFHPVRNYLDSLQWDGNPRIEMSLPYFLGADDNPYTRAVARKWFTAAVARIRKPGVKFDNMLILVGAQGIGKSTFFNRLAKRQEWFSDSLDKFDNSKESMEHLAGVWIIELGELSALKKYEVEHVKVFLSKQEDKYRKSYGRRTENYPRECVFAGTTNREDFLHDATGSRRFWPVKVANEMRFWKELTPEMVDQLWAEADALWKSGEDLFLSKEIAQMARKNQERYSEDGGKVGAAGEFLEIRIPINWHSMTIKEKQDFYGGFAFKPEDKEVKLMQRDEISGLELFVECFGGRIDSYTRRDAYEMTGILTALGWERSVNSRRVNGYGKQRTFSRIEAKK